ncbi:MAG: hypothetical protein DCC43_04920 [Candidatus Brocadia sp.]|nr:hypothetical protein [Candidatus Brocadia sp. AMX3]RIK01891.1 MAG: hypothetical protein DCC43_04920 [Candidatus Brocadia sp.]
MHFPQNDHRPEFTCTFINQAFLTKGESEGIGKKLPKKMVMQSKRQTDLDRVIYFSGDLGKYRSSLFHSEIICIGKSRFNDCFISGIYQR